jgi:hypothetical protein
LFLHQSCRSDAFCFHGKDHITLFLLCKI